MLLYDRSLARWLLTIISGPGVDGDLAVLYPGRQTVALAVPDGYDHYEPVIKPYTDGLLLVRFLWHANSTHVVASFPGLPLGRLAGMMREYFPKYVPGGALVGHSPRNCEVKALHFLARERVRLVDADGVSWRVGVRPAGWTLVGFHDDSLTRSVHGDSEHFEVRVTVDRGEETVEVLWAPHKEAEPQWVGTAQ